MACIEKIYSVSALVGSGACNGNCSFCSGKYLRPQAKGREDLTYWRNYEAAIKLSARYGGWSLSLTSSGEPTCSPNDVTKALEVYRGCAGQGAFFANVNLFTNGILFGDPAFCHEWLPRWRNLGLTNVAVSIHDTDEVGQARVYGLSEPYPAYEKILRNVRQHGVGVRATLLLRRGGVDNGEKFGAAIDTLRDKGFDNLTSWTIGNPDGSRTEWTPRRRGMLSIRYWLWRNTKKCHGHVWGGGVYDYKGDIVRLTDYVTKHDPRKDFVRQLVVFQDGLVAYSWIRPGALCMK